jgi:hypothetical protein
VGDYSTDDFLGEKGPKYSESDSYGRQCCMDCGKAWIPGPLWVCPFCKSKDVILGKPRGIKA